MYKFFSINTLIDSSVFINIQLSYKSLSKTYVLIDGGGGGGGSGKNVSHSSENDDREEFVADDEFIIMSD